MSCSGPANSKHSSACTMKSLEKLEEVERRSGLPSIKLLGCYEVPQVLVVHPDLTEVFCALNKVPPLLQRLNDGKYFLVVDLVVPFDQREQFRKEGNQMPLFILCRYLKEDSSGDKVRAVSFNSEGLG